jgi:hypothetical protein
MLTVGTSSSQIIGAEASPPWSFCPTGLSEFERPSLSTMAARAEMGEIRVRTHILSVLILLAAAQLSRT